MAKLVLLLVATLTIRLAGAQCQAAFTYTVNSGTVNFTNTSTFPGSFTSYWQYGDGYFDWTTSPSHSYQYAGSYTVSLVVYDSLPQTCQDTIVQVITVTGAPNPPCYADFNCVADSNPPYANYFNNFMSTYNTTWWWDFGDGNHDSTSGPTAMHQYATQGTFVATLTVITTMNDTCTFTDTVSSIPCSLLLTTGFTVQLSGGTVTLLNTSSGAANPNYQWSFGDGNYSNLQSPQHTYQFNGTYSICLTYTDSGGSCSEMHCDTVMITAASPYPCFAQFGYMPDSMGNGVNFYDQSTLNIVAWNWQFPGGTPSSSTGAGTTVQYPPGTYTVTLTVTNASGITCTYSNTVNVGTNCTNTNAYFTMQPGILPQVWNVTNNSTGAWPISYIWSWGDGTPNSTGPNPTHTYSVSGWYTICVTLVDGNGCGASYCHNDSLYKYATNGGMISVVVQTPNGIADEDQKNSDLEIYPNPSAGIICIRTANHLNRVRIFDPTGRELAEKIVPESGILDLDFLQSGVYLIKAESDDTVMIRRVVIY